MVSSKLTDDFNSFVNPLRAKTLKTKKQVSEYVSTIKNFEIFPPHFVS